MAGHPAGNGGIYGPTRESDALYAEALEMFRDTSLTIKEIAARTGVSAPGLKSYLRQWHKGESLRRRGYEWDGTSHADLSGSKQFSKSVAAKYAPAIASLKGNPRAMAKVAAEFGLNAEVFRQYLKVHEPGLVKALGMSRGEDGKLVKVSAAGKYAEAVHEYATTAESLRSIAERHGLVYKSLLGYINRNCPEARSEHEKRKVEGGDC